jgi:TonB family protein
VSALVAASPELKSLWIRVLKRVHPDLAVDEPDRRRCERLTKQANDAYARRDEVALRAVLEPKSSPPPRHAPYDAWEAMAEAQQAAPPQSTYQPPLAPQQPPRVSGSEAFGILGAACVVLCLLLYGIFDALSETVGRNTSVSFLVLLTTAVLWLITKNSKLSYNHKARWVAAVASGMILVAICLLDRRPRANPLFPSARAATAQALAAPVEWKDSDNPPPSQWYWDVIKSRVGQSWNPSAVVDTPAGATADVTFTIAHDGSPRDVQLRRPSGYLSFDSSCVLAVQQVRTFGPPEGGTKDRLKVLYPCSYSELESMNTHPPRSNTPQEKATVVRARPEPVESLGSQLGGYIEAAKNKVAQKWNSSEVAGSTPVGATVYIQFAIRRRGNHEVPTMETSSGSSSLDISCLRAVERIQTFDHLPKDYNGDSLTVLSHCTYPGSPTGSPTTKFAQDSTLPTVQPPPPYGPVDRVHGAQQPTKDPVVTN